MTDLNKLRDELADAHASRDGLTDPAKFYSYCAGWNARDKVLTDAAGEFDRAAFDGWKKQYFSKHGHFPDPWKCARWQFEQNRARTGHLTILLGHASVQCQKLEARLAESERALSEYSRIVTTHRNNIVDLSKANRECGAKLTASEARCKELEQELAKYEAEDAGEEDP